jgi:hypothetical protein
MLSSLIIITVLGVLDTAPAFVPMDALKSCLAQNTSAKERKDLVKWTFLALAAHPDIKAHASASAERDREDSSRTVATLVTRLLTEACVDEARAVMASGDGQASMEQAFASLGEMAMMELVVEKSVQDAMMRFTTFLDQQRMTEAFSKKQ